MAVCLFSSLVGSITAAVGSFRQVAWAGMNEMKSQQSRSTAIPFNCLNILIAWRQLVTTSSTFFRIWQQHFVAPDHAVALSQVQAEKMKQEAAVVAFFEERKLSAELFDALVVHQKESQKGPVKGMAHIE